MGVVIKARGKRFSSSSSIVFGGRLSPKNADNEICKFVLSGSFHFGRLSLNDRFHKENHLRENSLSDM